MKRLLNIVKTLVISLILILSSTAFGQNGYKFATERKGSVTSKTDIGYSFREIYPDKSPVYLKSNA